MNTIVITGTSRGIGKYLAKYYLKLGYRVIGCSRSPSTIEHTRYLHYYLDIGNIKEVEDFVFKIPEKEQTLCLINNAGIASMNSILLTPTESFENILRTNLLGTFNISREFAKIMVRNNYGRIINFSTIAVPMSLEGESAYVSSKAGIEAFTKVMAKELAPYNITVNAVAPTPIETDLIKNVGEDRIQAIINRQVIHRLGKFEDVSNVVEFLLSKHSDFITGQVIYLGGVF